MPNGKRVAFGESYNTLKRSLNYLDDSQSSGPAPILYPDVNTPQAQQTNNGGNANTPDSSSND